VSIALATVICSFFSQGLYLSDYRIKTACDNSAYVIQESNKNGIDPLLLSSLIFVESGWKKTAVSRANACGLTQVIPKYTGKITKKYTCQQLKNPRVSISAGAKILKWWIDYHKGKLTKNQKKKMSAEDIELYSLTRGLCGYNAGFRCHGLRPNRAGIRYAKKILSIRASIKIRSELK